MVIPSFDEEFIADIPDDIDDATVMVVERFRTIYTMSSSVPNRVDLLKDAYLFIRAFWEHRNVPYTIPNTDPDETAYNTLIEMLNNAAATAKVKKDKRDGKVYAANKIKEYRDLLEKIPTYEFSDDDYNRIQELINELRSEILSSKLITEDHRRRLLRRLEAMQAELHKKTSDIDRFWGFVAEAGIVTRKFGEDLKPISDRVNELGRIVIGVVMAKEGIKALPDIVKILQISQ